MSAAPHDPNDPARTVDHAPPDPDQTTDLPAPAAQGDTPRPHDTSVAPQGETATFEPQQSLDPLQTGAHAPSGDEVANATANPTIPGYEILGELGRGGMGVVFKARQLGLNRTVALKMILAGAHAAPTILARFVAEGQAVARFQHPNIVQVFAVGEFAGLPYFALEYVAGGTLSKRIAREPQPPKYAAEMAEQLARAMQYAHDRGIAHRDLKPANVLLTPDGLPKIADFGLAKELEGDSGQTHSGQIMGTPSFMAPEQAEGRPDVGAPADVWALGGILYDLLTGRPPFQGSSILDTLEMVRTREPVPPRELTGQLPQDLETICLKALQKDINKRYRSAGELADDLRRYLDGRPILARPVGTVEKAWRWALRNPAGAGVIGLAAALFVVLAFASVFLYVAEAKAAESAKNEAAAKEFAQGKQQEAEQALAKEQLALIAKDKALTDEQKARAAEEKAKRLEAAARIEAVEKGKLAAEQRNQALFTVRDVMLGVDELLRGRSNLAPLRLAILQNMLRRLDQIKVPDENSVIDLRTEAIGYSRIGQVYLDANRPDDAARWTGLAHALLRKLADESPGDQTALLNLSNITHQLADVEWQRGNGARSRELHAAAQKFRAARVSLLDKLVAEDSKRPDGKPYTAGDVTQATFMAYESLILAAQADLRAGDPDAAVERLKAAEKGFNGFFPKGVPATQVFVREKLAAVQDAMALARFQQGHADEAERLYRAALAEREKLAAEQAARQDGPRLAAQARETRAWLADLLLMVRGDVAGAFEQYDAILAPLAAALEKAPDLLALQRSVATLRYRLGYAAQARTGLARFAGAVEAAHHFVECLRLREGLAKIDPSDVSAQVEYLLALARAGRTAEAEKLALALLARQSVDSSTRFQAVCGLAVASGTAADPEAAKGLKDRAFAELAVLVKDWKARGVLDYDPDLETLRADPRFAALVAPAKGK